ncbi:mycofactocin precursor MftA [Blastococcus brunescens]|uniref:Mycofactocin MftA n=1 Tax=Blastococcus brunescens TaxID=1564165 RepID=A0ABZ1AY90_9ACTN|nr:mycofactocin precursor MftA [Blastococcus sp. BMG 8361]WRL63532.1 mycofactocin precursor MftA [Blastococcus sp. BMG 8361]
MTAITWSASCPRRTPPSRPFRSGPAVAEAEEVVEESLVEEVSIDGMCGVY